MGGTALQTGVAGDTGVSNNPMLAYFARIHRVLPRYHQLLSKRFPFAVCQSPIDAPIDFSCLWMLLPLINSALKRTI